MLRTQTPDEKSNHAKAILHSCFGTNGVWADPTRYRFQCWTRDLVIAVMPWLLETGQTKIVRTHLENLSKRQRPNGQIPIVFLDRVAPFLFDKIKRSLKDLKLSFMLRRFLKGELWNLTPGTRDSEILYIIGMYEYANRTQDRSLLELYGRELARACDYVESHLMRDGLVIGCDWRDTMEHELGDKTLLTNNCLLYRAYRLMGHFDKAETLRTKINTFFWNGTSYIDYPGSDRFDPLGGSFAVLFDVAPRERFISLTASFASVDSPAGVTIKCRHNPVSKTERLIIDRTDGVVVWPFVVGFSIMALMQMGQITFAAQQLQKLYRLDGFREWYDPNTGQGYGAIEQLWSAVLFLRARKQAGTPV